MAGSIPPNSRGRGTPSSYPNHEDKSSSGNASTSLDYVITIPSSAHNPSSTQQRVQTDAIYDDKDRPPSPPAASNAAHKAAERPPRKSIRALFNRFVANQASNPNLAATALHLESVLRVGTLTWAGDYTGAGAALLSAGLHLATTRSAVGDLVRDAASMAAYRFHTLPAGPKVAVEMSLAVGVVMAKKFLLGQGASLSEADIVDSVRFMSIFMQRPSDDLASM